ncbi:MAG: hypothetical protein KGQ37_09635 [Hyphomicrobiales bacterium]|nr:hypothetical protein [Hyphomicrobiales bacterium]
MSLLWPATPSGPFVFVGVTLILGGLGAVSIGRAMATTWNPVVKVLVYCALLAAGVQFLHYALYQERLLTLHYYLVNFAALAVIGVIAWRLQRVRQMTERYFWAFEKSGLAGWAARGDLNPPRQ